MASLRNLLILELISSYFFGKKIFLFWLQSLLISPLVWPLSLSPFLSLMHTVQTEFLPFSNSLTHISRTHWGRQNFLCLVSMSFSISLLFRSGRRNRRRSANFFATPEDSTSWEKASTNFSTSVNFSSIFSVRHWNRSSEEGRKPSVS